mmetsp:Transcript_15244/g.13351  ORF Transcript_15244/g.13351 Transcript_15244/m.13351 type:complete len:85 (+) Transcript_15244:25-279(+)
MKDKVIQKFLTREDYLKYLKKLEEQNDWKMIFESVYFLYELAEHAKVGNRTTELGLILFHTFLAKVSIMTYNTKVVAAAALYLA